jgi:hypothetical protein
MVRWTELALEVARSKDLGGTPAGERAMAELAPFVAQTARRIHAAHASLRRQRALDFVAMAPAMVWKKVEKFREWYDRELSPETKANPPKDFFAAWCYVELRYRYLDARRRQAREQNVYALSPFGAETIQPVSSLLGTAPALELTPRDVDRVRGWDPLDGVMVFCLTGQWDKLPPALWRHWLECLNLPTAFPPPAFTSAPRSQRRTVLAALLGVSRDVVYQRWLRLKRKCRVGLKQRRAA